jgi:dimethylhistidine N-methyltransferase
MNATSAATHLPAESSPVARAVAWGLSRVHKELPPWLFYDREGSHLFEEITELPEYYPTRTERAIFETYADAIVREAAHGARFTMIELGAGTATKTRILLAAQVRAQGACEYIPVDVSPTALEIARREIAGVLPTVRVRPVVCTTEESPAEIRKVQGRKLVLFIGSSIGNYDEDAAVALLRGVRGALEQGDALLLGTDLRKDLATLLPAYDDARGVTAAFNRNVLVRINRELGANFDTSRFRHVARWNAIASRVEMHLESTVDQSVTIHALGMSVRFRAGETIHTESSVKYDLHMVDRVLGRAGFTRERTFEDERHWFAVHLARTA